jgi:inosose dehydratase
LQPDGFAFSLDMVNRHYQEPNRNRFESRYYWEELYQLVAAAGFSAIELPYEPVWQFGGRSGVPLTRYCVHAKYQGAERFRAFLDRQGIRSVAGVSFDPSMFMRNSNLDFYFGAASHFAHEALSHAADLGASYFNISATPPFGRIRHYHPDMDAVEPGFIARTRSLLQSLAEDAEKRGVRLAIRHEYWSLLRGKRVFDLLENLPVSAGIDIDPASLLIGGEYPVQFIRDHGARIGSVHLTDTAFVDEDETWSTPNPEFPANRATQVYSDIGQGNVDLEKVYAALESVNYAGSITCSCRQTRDPIRALLRTRTYLDNHVIAAH